MKKRSTSLSLVLMGSLALTGTGCGGDSERVEIEEDFTIYGSVGECLAGGLYTEAECKDFSQTALQEVPTFTSQEDCEAQFGVAACQNDATQVASNTSSNSTEQVQARSHSSWSPLLMGYMAGRFLGARGPMQGAQPVFGTPNADGSKPNNFRTSTGESIKTDAKGKVSNPSAAVRQNVSHNAKPSAVRSGARSSGGFSGSRSFGGSTGS